MTALSVTLAGCGSSDNKTSDNSSKDSSAGQKIELIGSTSVTPLAQAIADEYSKDHDVTINVQGVGSTPGIEAAINGTADIGMASRDLKDEEKNSGLVEYKIATDAIAVTVNPDNKIGNLTTEQIQGIFTGKITNWKEVGGNDEPIIVISRESGSGTRGAFEEIEKLEQDAGDGKKISLVDNASPIIADGNGAVKSNVASKKGAIGYVSLGMVDDTIKKVKVDGVEATDPNAASGEYKLSRPFLLLTKGEKGGAVKDFLDYILSDDGQKLVQENGYIKVK